MAGTLILLGKTHPVLLKASNFNCYMSPMLKAEVRGGDFENTLVRSQYGMAWGLNLGFSDNVRLVVHVEAVRQVSEVAGTLILLGKTHPVLLKASNFNCYMSPMLKAEVRGGDFENTLVRSQYGMAWGLNLGFSDNVRLVVHVEAVRQP